MSEEDGILVIDLREHITLALISPRREVRMAQPDQSAGRAKPWCCICIVSAVIFVLVVTSPYVKSCFVACGFVARFIVFATPEGSGSMGQAFAYSPRVALGSKGSSLVGLRWWVGTPGAEKILITPWIPKTKKKIHRVIMF